MQTLQKPMLAAYAILSAAGVALLLAAAPGGGPGGAPGAAPRGGRRAAPSGPPEGISRVKLYEKTPHVSSEGGDRDADPLEPTIDVYPLKDSPSAAAGVLVLPGGGYTNLSMANEGSSIARMFNEKGLAAFVVRYRHAPRYHSPIPLEDAQRAARFVRAHAKEYNIDPEKLGVIGFSAGGHNAAALATATDNAGKADAADPVERESAAPAFAILVYPVIDLTDDAVTHRGSRDALTNKDPSLYEALSPQKHVSKGDPPMFIVQGGEDRTVPIQNSILMYEACKAAGVPAELHLFEHGGHGFGLDVRDPAIRIWPELAMNWLAANKIVAPATK
ncbi:MAG TPA: alpha/beta hydrolase [Phycisphaerae bacterium]|nr:alpha/beta hydrolase [Phycisphaerae bacterium]